MFRLRRRDVFQIHIDPPYTLTEINPHFDTFGINPKLFDHTSFHPLFSQARATWGPTVYKPCLPVVRGAVRPRHHSPSVCPLGHHPFYPSPSGITSEAMVWDHIPKEEARQMAAVWAMEDMRKREPRSTPATPADPPGGSTTPVYQGHPPLHDAIGYLNDGSSFEFKAHYHHDQWWSRYSDEPMRSTTHAHLKNDPSTVLWDKRPKRNSNPLEDWLSSGKDFGDWLSQDSVELDTRPAFKEIPGDDFITPELMGALGKIFGQVHVARRENSKRLGGVDYRLWAVNDDGKFPLGGWIYRHPKIKFRTSINGKFDFGEGRQGSFIFSWDSRLSATEQEFGKDGLLYTKERYGEQPIFSECPGCQNRSLLQRGPQEACHACSRSSTRAYKLAAELGVPHTILGEAAKELGIRYRNYMTPIGSEGAAALRKKLA